MIFFCNFIWNFLARVEYKRNSGLNFFFSFSAYIIPFWLEIMAKRGFLIFWIFLQFFSELSSLGRVWPEFRTKFFFFSFSAYLIPFWVKIMQERGFLIFLIFFFYFPRYFLARVEYERNSGLKFFFSFSASLNPFWIEMVTELSFLIFWIFFFFFGIFLPGSSMNGIRD